MAKTLEERIVDVMKIGETRKVHNLARSLRVKVEDIIDATHSAPELDLLVGFCCAAGSAELAKTEWEVERFQ